MAAGDRKVQWGRVARRVRVPLGFATAAVFLLFARPTPRSMALSLAAVLPGLALRAYAAGYVRKNAELTRTGPYAYTRNPLYLGSMLIAFGFAIAAGRVWLAVLLLALFLAIYLPTILSEEAYLREAFADFEAYAQRVPRLVPRWTPARFPGASPAGGRSFSRERYLHHREYNSLMGSVALYAALLLRLLWAHRS